MNFLHFFYDGCEIMTSFSIFLEKNKIKWRVEKLEAKWEELEVKGT